MILSKAAKAREKKREKVYQYYQKLMAQPGTTTSAAVNKAADKFDICQRTVYNLLKHRQEAGS